MSRFEEYRSLYCNIAFERRGGVVQMRLHTEGGALTWASNQGGIHTQLGDAFNDLTHDPDLRALILTGTGSVFCTELNAVENPTHMDASTWVRLLREGREMLRHLLDIEVPVIAAVNGPVHIHSELPVLADIVLAADTADFADRVHLIYGVVPGDGVHVIWPLLLGPNRGRHFLMTGASISAGEAQRLGFVAEVLGTDHLQERAWAIGAEFESKPEAAMRATRLLLTRRLRRELSDDLELGLAIEGLGILSRRS